MKKQNNQYTIKKPIKKDHKSIWIYGKHPVISALSNENRKVFQLVISDRKLLSEFSHLINDQITVKIEDNKYLSSLLPKNSIHQNCALEVSYLKQPSLEDFVNDPDNQCVLILDQVTDPHNVGAIIRSAAAFSCNAVITTYDNSPEENSTLIKSSSGCFELIPYIKVTNLKTAMKYLKENGYWCVGLDSNTDHYISSIEIPKKVAFILGSEDKGLRQLTKVNCDFIVKLPIASDVDSLNVSNAASIALYEYRRNFKL